MPDIKAQLQRPLVLWSQIHLCCLPSALGCEDHPAQSMIVLCFFRDSETFLEYFWYWRAHSSLQHLKHLAGRFLVRNSFLWSRISFPITSTRQSQCHTLGFTQNKSTSSTSRQQLGHLNQFMMSLKIFFLGKIFSVFQLPCDIGVLHPQVQRLQALSNLLVLF